MPKQIKQTSTDDASKFFDAMEEKMEAEYCKRRKLSQQPAGFSQPELSFLQFNPKANTGEESICYFNNRGFSQPASNKSNLNKKSWRPPMKTVGGSDTLKSNFLNKENWFKQDKMSIKDVMSSSKDTNHKLNVPNNCVENISAGAPSAMLLSSLFQQPITKPQTVTIHLSNSTPNFSENKESSNPLNQITLCSEINLASGSLSSVSDLSFAKNNAREEIDTLKEEPCNSKEIDSNKTRDNQSALPLLKREISEEALSERTCEMKEGENDILDNELKKETQDKIISDKTFTIDNYKEHCDQVKNNNTIKSEKEDAIMLAEMLTQENVNLRGGKILEACEETGCKDKNMIADNNEPRDIDNKEAELKDSSSICEQQEDIINSIDVILSEGQNIQSNSLSQEENNSCKNNVEDKNNLSLVDSVFENSSSENESEFYDSNTLYVTASKSLLEISHNSKQCVKECITNDEPQFKNYSEKRRDNEERSCSNIDQREEGTTQMEVTKATYSLNPNTSEGNTENGHSIPRTSINQPLHCNGKNIQDEVRALGKDEKSICDVPEDEYSCLMISNSQLLEIENNYYQTPSKKEPTSIGKNDNNAYVESMSNKQFVSVGSQTELYANSSTEKTVPLKTPQLQWPGKMIETQRRLRETIQEIQRLNGILLQIRQEIWPNSQQNIREMNKPGVL